MKFFCFSFLGFMKSAQNMDIRNQSWFDQMGFRDILFAQLISMVWPIYFSQKIKSVDVCVKRRVTRRVSFLNLA